MFRHTKYRNYQRVAFCKCFCTTKQVLQILVLVPMFIVHTKEYYFSTLLIAGRFSAQKSSQVLLFNSFLEPLQVSYTHANSSQSYLMSRPSIGHVWNLHIVELYQPEDYICKCDNGWNKVFIVALQNLLLGFQKVRKPIHAPTFEVCRLRFERFTRRLEIRTPYIR